MTPTLNPDTAAEAIVQEIRAATVTTETSDD
jgi:hypothetical protein